MIWSQYYRQAPRPHPVGRRPRRLRPGIGGGAPRGGRRRHPRRPALSRRPTGDYVRIQGGVLDARLLTLMIIDIETHAPNDFLFLNLSVFIVLSLFDQSGPSGT